MQISEKRQFQLHRGGMMADKDPSVHILEMANMPGKQIFVCLCVFAPSYYLLFPWFLVGEKLQNTKRPVI